MAKPRMAKSARVTELNPELPSSTMPGAVAKTIPSPHPRQPEKAQIAVDGAGEWSIADLQACDERAERISLLQARLMASVAANPAASGVIAPRLHAVR
jgi:hypothetical protein